MLTKKSMGMLFLALNLSGAGAWAMGQSPVYLRDRQTVDGRGAWRAVPPGPLGPNGWYYPGGWYAPQTYAGSWYQRPYPSHFDYYRWRYQTPTEAPSE